MTFLWFQPLVEHGTQYSVRTASAASATSAASADESYATSDGFESLSEASSPKPRSVVIYLQEQNQVSCYILTRTNPGQLLFEIVHY